MVDQLVQAEVVYQRIETGLVLGQRVVVVEAIHLDVVQIEFIAGEHSFEVHVLWQLFR